MTDINNDFVYEESRNADGSSIQLMRSKVGITLCESIFDARRQLIERRDYDETGRLKGRAVYEQDGEHKPLKTTAYDANGALIFVQERGRAPVFYGTHRAGKPKQLQSPEPDNGK